MHKTVGVFVGAAPLSPTSRFPVHVDHLFHTNKIWRPHLLPAFLKFGVRGALHARAFVPAPSLPATRTFENYPCTACVRACVFGRTYPPPTPTPFSFLF